MKKIINSVAILTVLLVYLISCQKEKPNSNNPMKVTHDKKEFSDYLAKTKVVCQNKISELENQEINAVSQRRFEVPENTNNPYDAFGKFHNDMLDNLGFKKLSVTDPTIIFAINTVDNDGKATSFECNGVQKKIFGYTVSDFYTNNPTGPIIPSAIYDLMQTESHRITSQNVHLSLDFYESQGVINSNQKSVLTIFLNVVENKTDPNIRIAFSKVFEDIVNGAPNAFIPESDKEKIVKFVTIYKYSSFYWSVDIDNVDNPWNGFPLSYTDQPGGSGGGGPILSMVDAVGVYAGYLWCIQNQMNQNLNIPELCTCYTPTYPWCMSNLMGGLVSLSVCF